MSFPALAWASKYRADSAAEKLVLLAFADRHNEETGCAYPSLDWLCEFSSLNRKTVIAAIGKLEATGVLTDTGARMGRTKQIKVYSVAVETIPKTEPSQKRNSTENSVKQYRKRDTEPSFEPISSEAKASSDKVDFRPEHVRDEWNKIAERCGLAKVRNLEGSRLAKLKARIRIHPPDDWIEVFDAIERTPWMHGANDRGWRINFDFLLEPLKFTKILEGTYERSNAIQ